MLKYLWVQKHITSNDYANEMIALFKSLKPRIGAFDTETTGFNAGGKDQMIEIGAVKMKDGEVIERFDELIDPKRPLPSKITELTCITDEMLEEENSKIRRIK